MENCLHKICNLDKILIYVVQLQATSSPFGCYHLCAEHSVLLRCLQEYIQMLCNFWY